MILLGYIVKQILHNVHDTTTFCYCITLGRLGVGIPPPLPWISPPPYRVEWSGDISLPQRGIVYKQRVSVLVYYYVNTVWI